MESCTCCCWKTPTPPPAAKTTGVSVWLRKLFLVCLQVEIPVKDCGFPRSDSLLGIALSSAPEADILMSLSSTIAQALSPLPTVSTESFSLFSPAVSPALMSPTLSVLSPAVTPARSCYTTPTKSVQYDPPRSPHTPTSIFNCSVTSAMSPCDVTLSPLNISAADISDAGTYSRLGCLLNWNHGTTSVTCKDTDYNCRKCVDGCSTNL